MRVGGLAAGLLLCATTARGQAEPTSAEALYQRGIAAFNAHDYVVACRSLSESYRLDPQPGALFTEATCEMRAGKIATAAQHYADFITLADSLAPEARERQLERRAVAVEQRGALLPQIPTVRVVLRGRSSSPTQLTLDGQPLDSESLSVDLPLDPGEHVLEQRSSAGVASIKRINLARGEHQTLVVQATEEARKPSSAATPPAAPPRSLLPYVLGGAGLVGLGVGGVAGIMAIAKKGVVNDECDGTSCSARGLAAADAGKRDALVSTIGFGVGVVGLGAGLVLLLTTSKDPSNQSRSSSLLFAGDRLLWRGSF